MTLIKTSLLTFISTAFKMLTGLVINKAVALYIGPGGLALIGQFQSFMQIVMTAAQGGINAGVTKYTAEYGKESGELPKLLSTAAKISVICSGIIGLMIIILSNFLSKLVFQTEEYSYIFYIFGFTIILFVFNSLLLAILNGLKEIKVYIKINITQSLYSLVFTTLLIYFLALDGALIALVTNQSIIFIYLLWYMRKHDVLKLSYFIMGSDPSKAVKLSKYALMTLVSATCVPGSHFVIRSYIGDTLGWEKAGYWQAIWYISSIYLMVITTALSVYYLPRLSEINDRSELLNELQYGFKIILPIVTCCSLLIFLLKDVIIYLLFTESFMPMRELFLWQLIGDVLKIASWLIAYVLLAKAKVKLFVTTEILFSASFILLSIYFVNGFGIVGMTYAFALNYLLYFISVFISVKKYCL